MRTYLKAVVWCGLLLGASQVHAQGGPPGMGDIGSRPTVSPYLNLLNNPAGFTNYQTQVRPFIDQQQATARQGASISQLQRQVRDVRSLASRRDNIRTTGHTTRFMNYSHYYAQSPQQRGR